MDTVFLALRVALSLAAVLALLWLLQRRLGKRGGKRAAAGSITVVGRQSVGRRANVIMVDVDGTRLLLGVTDQTVSVLHSADVPEERSTADEFAQSLQEATMPARSIAAHSAAVSSGTTVPSGTGEPGASVAMLRPRRDRSAVGKLGGSILSPATWKQTGAALRQSR